MVTDGVHLGTKVPDPCLDHDKGPGQHQRHHHIDHLSENHVLPLSLHYFSQKIALLEATKQPLQQKNGKNVANKKKNLIHIGCEDAGGDFELNCTLAVNHFLTEAWDMEIDSKHAKCVGVDILIDFGEVFEYTFWHPEVEEDVEAAHGEVVDKTEEVDVDGDGACHLGDYRCGLSSLLQRTIDSLVGSCLVKA